MVTNFLGCKLQIFKKILIRCCYGCVAIVAKVTIVAMVTMFYYCTGLQVLGCNTGSFNILALLIGRTQGPL